jgi:hypothetical protein
VIVRMVSDSIVAKDERKYVMDFRGSQIETGSPS